MFQRETLKDGSVRLRGDTCTFVITRLRPSVLLVTIVGHDRGEFGSAPFAEFEAEIARFHRPVALFVDAKDGADPTPAVQEAWQAWFVRNHESLAAVHMLAATRPLQLTASIVQHLSRTGRLFRIHSDAAAFEALVRQSAPDFGGLPATGRAGEPPLDVRRETLPDGALQLRTEGCTLTQRRLRPGALLLTIGGNDSGEFGPLPLDMAAEEIRAADGPATLFVDCGAVTGVAPRVTEDWTAWFQANEASLRQVHLLAGSAFVHLTVSIASHFARTGDLVRVYTDAEKFREALTAEVPGERTGRR